MLQNPRKTLGFKKNMVYKIPSGGGGKPYPASGLNIVIFNSYKIGLEITRNPVFGEFVNNKGADQPVHSGSLISAFKQHKYEQFVHADGRNYSQFYSEVISNLRTVF